MSTRSFADDDDLELRNVPFWEALLHQIRRDGFRNPPRCVLDVGCHRGGLLARIAEVWGPAHLFGIEPHPTARARAVLRLRGAAPHVELLGPEDWKEVGDGSVDLVVSHEVLFLLPQLEPFVASLARVLAPTGRAYIAAGCHAENPIWPAWKTQLEAEGVATFTHSPVDLMAAAARHGLVASVRPLRDEGWATHDFRTDSYTFPSVAALLDHQFRFKLLFRFSRP